MGGILVGIVTSRDVDFAHEPDMSRPIKEVRNVPLLLNEQGSCTLLYRHLSIRLFTRNEEFDVQDMQTLFSELSVFHRV